MARKFKRSLRSSNLKKRLAKRQTRIKSEPVLSVELVGKEYLAGIKALINRVLSGFKKYRSKLSLQSHKQGLK